MIYVYVTEKCWEEATECGLKSHLEKIRDDVETRQMIHFQPFPPTPFWKKGITRSHRLLIREWNLGEDSLYSFEHVLSRGSQDYIYFFNNCKRNTREVERRFVTVSEQMARQIIRDRKGSEPVRELPTPSETESNWLYGVASLRGESQDDVLILETEEWVQEMLSKEMVKYHVPYYQLLSHAIVEEQRLQESRSKNEVHICWDDNRRRGFAYVYRPDQRRIVLLTPLHHADRVESKITAHRDRLSQLDESETARELSRVAYRAYPEIVLYDEDCWMAIQKDQEANLALSPEEIELLESVRRGGDSGKGYPLFINGRAGSGKSTMLLHLAVEYLLFALRQQDDLVPLYVTFSRDLLEVARRTVRSLLTIHHEQLTGNHANYDMAQIDDLLARSFVVFHEHVRDLLPARERDKFHSDKFVHYPKFLELWQRDFVRRPEARKISADVAWHTIRSYIKGMRSSLDDDLSPEEFEGLPSNRRSIDMDAYQFVYERVWEGWYKRLCDREGYWDDQDLAVAVLDSRHNVATYPAIFCDEAQDFTSAELDLILRMCLFSAKQLTPEQLRTVPIVFAGDPLQTINPTGFRWDAFQANFHERFFVLLHPHRRTNITLRHEELSLNYRSNPGIVHFCNLILLLRATLFGDREANPQQTWWVETPVQPIWIDADNPQTRDELRRHPELVKIVNCEYNREVYYAEKDEVLRDLPLEEGVPKGVLSPVRAKGQEFHTTVLYRFGDSDTAKGIVEMYQSLADGTYQPVEDRAQLLKYEYFLNRLYVAASRAKKQLFIVDSRQALDSFWKFAFDEGFREALERQAAASEAWRDKTRGLVAGQPQALSGKPIDQLEQASELARAGRQSHDPYLLRQAAGCYRGVNKQIDAERCLAEALRFEEKFADAGKRYEGIGDAENAFRCYWNGRLFRHLCELASSNPGFSSRPESRASDFVVHDEGVPEEFLSAVLSDTQDDEWVRVAASDESWCYIFGTLAKRLANAERDIINIKRWSRLHAMFERLCAAGMPLNADHRAAIAYKAGQDRIAVEIWDSTGNTEHSEYCQAKAKVEPFPRNLPWLSRLNFHKQILQEYRKHRMDTYGSGSLAEDAAMAVITAAIAEQNGHLALELLAEHPENDEHIKAVLKIAVREQDADLATAGACLLIRRMVARQSWRATVRAAENADFRELGHPLAKELQSLLKQSDGMQRVFNSAIWAFATSSDLPGSKQQQIVSEFLRRHFVASHTAKSGRQSLPVEVVGAAIERAGLITLSFQYYENIEKDRSASDRERRFAVQRQIRNQERYAGYLRSIGDESQAIEREHLARELRKKHGFSQDAVFPDYPEVSSDQMNTSELRSGIDKPFVWEFRPRENRVRIKHDERDEAISIYYLKPEVRGEVDCSEMPPTEGEWAWSIAEWDLILRLRTEGDALKLRLEHGGRFVRQIEVA